MSAQALRILAGPVALRRLRESRAELLARLGRAMSAAGGPELERVVVEVPLRTWVDVAGSRVRPRDFLVAVRDLWRIRRRYPPQRRGGDGTT